MNPVALIVAFGAPQLIVVLAVAAIGTLVAAFVVDRPNRRHR